MDDYSNYVGLLPALRDSKEENEEKVEGMNEAMKEKIKQFTDPIGENFMTDAFQGLTRKAGVGLKDALLNAGASADDVEKYKSAYKKGGVKGIIKQGLQDGKQKVADAIADKLGTTAEKVGQEVKETKIGDLEPEEYGRLKNFIKAGQQERFNSFKEEEQRSIRRKFLNNKLEPKDEPNNLVRNQKNAQIADDAMDDMEERNQALDPSKISQRVLQATGDDDDSLLNTTQKTIQGFQQVAKDKLEQTAGEVGKVGEKVGEDVAKAGVKEGENLAKAGAKAGETAGEIEAEGGGPEDLIGDVVAGIAGIATFLGGIHASKHLHEQSANDLISNVSYQAGA